jgi:hypothetical protein
MNDELSKLLSQLVTPSGRVMDGLYGAAHSTFRVSLMRLITRNPKLPKTQCGANAVFESLCSLAKVNPNHSHAGREAELVKWIQANHPQRAHEAVING